MKKYILPKTECQAIHVSMLCTSPEDPFSNPGGKEGGGNAAPKRVFF